MKCQMCLEISRKRNGLILLGRVGEGKDVPEWGSVWDKSWRTSRIPVASDAIIMEESFEVLDVPYLGYTGRVPGKSHRKWN